MLKRLSKIKELNANVVRLFLFADMQGFELDEDKNIKGLSVDFLKNFDDAVAMARKIDLKIYAVLLDSVSISIKIYDTDLMATPLDSGAPPLANSILHSP